MEYRSWLRLAAAAFGTAVCCLFSASCEKTSAQPAARAESCHAEVASVDTSTACPTAHIKFHVSVPDCDGSSGAFEYDYMQATEGVKVVRHSSGVWSSANKELDQVENVPLACDAQLGNVTNVHVTDCRCPG